MHQRPFQDDKQIVLISSSSSSNFVNSQHSSGCSIKRLQTLGSLILQDTSEDFPVSYIPLSEKIISSSSPSIFQSNDPLQNEATASNILLSPIHLHKLTILFLNLKDVSNTRLALKYHLTRSSLQSIDRHISLLIWTSSSSLHSPSLWDSLVHHSSCKHDDHLHLALLD